MSGLDAWSFVGRALSQDSVAVMHELNVFRDRAVKCLEAPNLTPEKQMLFERHLVVTNFARHLITVLCPGHTVKALQEIVSCEGGELTMLIVFNCCADLVSLSIDQRREIVERTPGLETFSLGKPE